MMRFEEGRFAVFMIDERKDTFNLQECRMKLKASGRLERSSLPLASQFNVV